VVRQTPGIHLSPPTAISKSNSGDVLRLTEPSKHLPEVAPAAQSHNRRQESHTLGGTLVIHCNCDNLPVSANTARKFFVTSLNFVCPKISSTAFIRTVFDIDGSFKKSENTGFCSAAPITCRLLQLGLHGIQHIPPHGRHVQRRRVAIVDTATRSLHSRLGSTSRHCGHCTLAPLTLYANSDSTSWHSLPETLDRTNPSSVADATGDLRISSLPQLYFCAYLQFMGVVERGYYDSVDILSSDFS
jgi:hypothetical protein